MTYPPPPPPYDPTAYSPPPAGHHPPADPPAEAPVTSPYGAYPPPPYGNPRYAAGKATPQYPPTASYPVLEPPAPPPRSGPRVLLGLLVGAVVMMLVCVAGIIAAFALRGDGQPSAAAPEPPATRAPAGPTAPAAVDGHTVVYEVSGDGPVGITYLKDARGGTEQVRNVTLPWRAEVVITEDSFVVTVIAVRLGLNEGTIACRVLVDGQERAVKESARGNFASATCADLILG